MLSNQHHQTLVEHLLVNNKLVESNIKANSTTTATTNNGIENQSSAGIYNQQKQQQQSLFSKHLKQTMRAWEDNLAMQRHTKNKSSLETNNSNDDDFEADDVVDDDDYDDLYDDEDRNNRFESANNQHKSAMSNTNSDATMSSNAEDNDIEVDVDFEVQETALNLSLHTSDRGSSLRSNSSSSASPSSCSSTNSISAKTVKTTTNNNLHNENNFMPFNDELEARRCQFESIAKHLNLSLNQAATLASKRSISNNHTLTSPLFDYHALGAAALAAATAAAASTSTNNVAEQLQSVKLAGRQLRCTTDPNLNISNNNGQSSSNNISNTKFQHQNIAVSAKRLDSSTSKSNQLLSKQKYQSKNNQLTSKLNLEFANHASNVLREASKLDLQLEVANNQRLYNTNSVTNQLQQLHQNHLTTYQPNHNANIEANIHHQHHAHQSQHENRHHHNHHLDHDHHHQHARPNHYQADSADLDRIRAFIDQFKSRRGALGLTQKQAAQCFRYYTNDRYQFSDNFVGHFEGFQFRPQTAMTIADSLSEWLEFAENETRFGRQLQFMQGKVKETRKRKYEVIRIRDSAKKILVEAFEKNKSPSTNELEILSRKTNIPSRNIEIFFKNRRTSRQYHQ